MAEGKTWDEVMSNQFNSFKEYVKEQMKTIEALEESIMKRSTELVELSKGAYEPGMDYYGVDSLSQAGVGRKLTTLEEDTTDLYEAEKLLKELDEDLRRRVSHLK